MRSVVGTVCSFPVAADSGNLGAVHRFTRSSSLEASPSLRSVVGDGSWLLFLRSAEKVPDSCLLSQNLLDFGSR